MRADDEKTVLETAGELLFSSLPLRGELFNNLASLGFSQMTPVQAQSLPLMLNHQDVIVQAQTGSGKTVAFGLALLNAIKMAWFQPQALVLCPTRELAEQISQVLRRLARLLPNLKVLNLSGGIPMRPQVDSLRYGAHIIIGTPGRIQKHLEKGTLVLTGLRTLVLDEADRMLDMGFLEPLKKVLSFCPEKRQTLLFSATFPPAIIELAGEFLHRPQQIKVAENHQVLDITQTFFEVSQQTDKYPLLRRLLSHYQPTSTLIFCNTKEKTQEVASLLSKEGFHAHVLHGDLDQAARDQAVIQFSNHSSSILVATDVAARGLDIKALPAVINYDLAFDSEVHIHRIGRTGRAGCKGIALSITTPKDAQRLCLIEEALGTALEWGNEAALQGESAVQDLKPRMVTLRLMAGKKDKIRPGDILGALTKDAGLAVDTVGKIDISTLYSYVAVDKTVVSKAYTQFNQGKLKGKKIAVQQLP